MPIDYSKWDNLELSDDSDVEVHPNVDKKSFIRMKQRQVHEERIKRDNDIKLMRQQNDMYEHLNKRVDSMLLKLNNENLFEEKSRNAYLRENFDPQEKSSATEDLPTYNEMVEDLFTQIFEDNKPVDGAAVRKLVLDHRAKITAVSKQNNAKLEQLYHEKSKHITSEDIHTGFDSFYTNKDVIKTESSAESKKATKVETNHEEKPRSAIPAVSGSVGSSSKSAAESASSTAVDSSATTSTTTTAADPASTANSALTSTATSSAPKTSSKLKEAEELENLKTYPETDEFGSIPFDDYASSAKYLRSNPFIVNENQKDGLLMKAFDYQLKGDTKTARNIVHQSLCLKFIDELIKDHKDLAQVERAISMFFAKVIQDNKLLLQETETTYNHIRNRCEVIKNEQNDEPVEQIQLKSLDPNSTLTVNIPEEGTEQYKEFLKLPEEMRTAVKTGSLDAINEVLGAMSVGDAENILDLFEKSGVIGIQAVLENEEEWDKMKDSSGIELTSTDPSSELVILQPDPNDPETFGEFQKLPQKMKEAVMSGSLAKVNQVFASDIKSDEAEGVLHLLEGSGVLALKKVGVPMPSTIDEID